MYRTANRIGWASIVVALVVGLAVALRLPAGEQFPIHWNARGEVDGWGTRSTVIWTALLMPAVGVFTHLLLWGMTKLDGIRQTLEPSARIYSVIWIGTMVFLALMQMGMMWLILSLAQRGLAGGAGATELPDDMADLFVSATMVALGGLMIVMGNYFGKIRRNPVFGIRTPFTLTSEPAWNRTHRVGGRLFVGLGLAVIVAAFIHAWLSFAVLMVGLTGVLIFVFAYSYNIWKSDPDRS